MTNDKCFQYAIIAALNHENRKYLERTPKIKPFINQCERKEKFPAEVENWKKFGANIKTIPLIVLFLLSNRNNIKQAYISKLNSERQNKVNIEVPDIFANNYTKIKPGAKIYENSSFYLQRYNLNLKKYKHVIAIQKTHCLHDYHRGEDCMKNFVKNAQQSARVHNRNH